MNVLNKYCKKKKKRKNQLVKVILIKPKYKKVLAIQSFKKERRTIFKIYVYKNFE